MWLLMQELVANTDIQNQQLLKTLKKVKQDMKVQHKLEKKMPQKSVKRTQETIDTQGKLFQK